MPSLVGSAARSAAAVLLAASAAIPAIKAQDFEVTTVETAYSSKHGISVSAAPTYDLKFEPLVDPRESLRRFEPIRIRLPQNDESFTIEFSENRMTYTAERPVELGANTMPMGDDQSDRDWDAELMSISVALLLLPEPSGLSKVAGGLLAAAGLVNLLQKIVADIDAYHQSAVGGEWISGRLWIVHEGRAQEIYYEPTRYQNPANYIRDDLATIGRPGHIREYLGGIATGWFARIAMRRYPEWAQDAVAEFGPQIFPTDGGGNKQQTTIRDQTGRTVSIAPPDMLRPILGTGSSSPRVQVVPMSTILSQESALPVAAVADLREWAVAGVSDLQVWHEEDRTVTIIPNVVDDGNGGNRQESSRGGLEIKRFTVTGTPFGSFSFGN